MFDPATVECVDTARETTAQHDQKLHNQSGRNNCDASNGMFTTLHHQACLDLASASPENQGVPLTESETLLHTNPGNPVLASNDTARVIWPDSRSLNWREFYMTQYMIMTLVKGGYLEEKMKINIAMAKASSASTFYSKSPVSDPH